jgi:hypothetical protein
MHEQSNAKSLKKQILSSILNNLHKTLFCIKSAMLYQLSYRPKVVCLQRLAD